METKTQLPVPSPDSRELSKITRQDLTSRSEQTVNETSVTAVATKARAEIEAAYLVAKKFPRSEDDARIKILHTCRIPSFAEKAKYRKPIGAGKTVDGPSIRLAEEMFRQWGNMRVETTVLYEDDLRRIVQILSIDLESGAAASAQFIVEKTVERKSTIGRVVIDERINSYGEKVSIVKATEDEMLTKTNALASKFRRNLIVQMIPAHILEDALKAVEATSKKDASENPDKTKKIVMDNFAKIGVMPSDIEKWLGHPLAQVVEDELVELKEIFTSINDRETTWAEVLEDKLNPKEEAAGPVKASMDLKPGDPATHQPVNQPAHNPLWDKEEKKK